MSASREKNKRKDLGTETAPEAKKGMSKGLKTTLMIVCAVVVAALIAFFALLNGGFFANHSTAAVVSGHKLTPVQYHYYFYDTLAQNSQYLSMFGITDVSALKDEVIDEETGKTFKDYFDESAMLSAAQTLAVYDEAVANGYTLSEAAQADLDSMDQLFDLYALYNGLTSGDAYLQSQYGPYASVKTYKEYCRVMTLANEYSQKIAADFSYSDSKLADEYAADPGKYDTVNYRFFNVLDSMFDETDADKLKQLRLETGEKMAQDSYQNEQAFIDAPLSIVAEDSKATYEDPDATLRANYGRDAVPASAQEWLFDPARQEGDTICIDNDTFVSVLYFLSYDNLDYPLPNLRIIPFTVDDITDELAMAQAKTSAEELLKQYEAGEKNAEAFMALDTANAFVAENVQPDADSKALADWAFEKLEGGVWARLEGDTAVVEGASGYYVVYYDGLGENYRNVKVDTALRNADYSEWYAATVADADYTLKGFGMFIADK